MLKSGNPADRPGSRGQREESIRVIPAKTTPELASVRKLFREYADSLGFDLDFQNFDQEMRSFPRGYSPPEGRLLLAMCGRHEAGCVGLRRSGRGICEMKRLFVRDGFRGRGIGKLLAEAVVKEARDAGYTRMRLDTVASMEEARGIYIKMGFRKIPPYRHNPIPGAIFMELEL